MTRGLMVSTLVLEALGVRQALVRKELRALGDLGSLGSGVVGVAGVAATTADGDTICTSTMPFPAPARGD